MSYARCPICHTLFRVTAEQLDARGGRVRCGQCANVFNALEHPAAMEIAAVAVPEETARENIPPEELPAVLVSNRRDAAPLPEEEPLLAQGGDERVEPVILSEAAESVPLTPFAVDWKEDAPAAPGEFVPSVPPPRHSPAWPWVTALFLLGFLALLQSAWVFRADLAMAYPELRPGFVAGCLDLGCDMPLPRESAQIGIEASDLRPAKEGLLKLSATLRNRAAYPQAWPNLELTLTDTDDKPLARRVFTPGDFLPAKTDANAGFAANGDLPISLILDTSPLSPAGYRLYVFYP